MAIVPLGRWEEPKISRAEPVKYATVGTDEDGKVTAKHRTGIAMRSDHHDDVWLCYAVQSSGGVLGTEIDCKLMTQDEVDTIKVIGGEEAANILPPLQVDGKAKPLTAGMHEALKHAYELWVKPLLEAK